jgi:hypothetical protein
LQHRAAVLAIADAHERTLNAERIDTIIAQRA